MSRLDELRAFVHEVDRELQRGFPFQVDEVRDSGSPDVQYTMVGHAAVFNRWSLDLGGFREQLAPGAFDDVLASDPHVVHVWDHDTRFVLSSTANDTLSLRADEDALHYESRVAPTSYAKDLGVLLRRGDVDQSSFAFTVPDDGDDWQLVDGVIERTVMKIDGLYDITTCAMGAYPQTTSALAVRSMANKRDKPQTLLPYTVSASTGNTVSVTGLDFRQVGQEDVAPSEVGEPQTGEPVASKDDIDRLKRQAAAGLLVARQRLLRGKE